MKTQIDVSLYERFLIVFFFDSNVRYCPKADISLFPITNLKFPAHGIKFPVKFLGKSMKNYVVSGGYMRRIPINAIKNEKFPVNSLFFREFRSETGYRKTASTTTHLRLTYGFCARMTLRRKIYHL